MPTQTNIQRSSNPAPPIRQPNNAQRIWIRFCQAVVRVFYRKCEAQGLHHLPGEGPVILCANHLNALADGVLLQAVSPRPLHPLARSGLFRRPLLGLLLRFMQAIPVYRRHQDDANPERNRDTFRRCFQLLGNGGVLLIFPEGQSHSDPALRPVKTGAARIALGARARIGVAPTVIPVGLTFPEKGQFRSPVLVQWGPPIPVPATADPDNEQDVRDFTQKIREGLEAVTLNAETWEHLDFLKRVERFFALREGKYRRRDMGERLESMQRLVRAERHLRARAPELVSRVRERLQAFEKLCLEFGVRDYHLTLQYGPGAILRFIVRGTVFLLVVLPLALWGVINSALPFYLTRYSARYLARSDDQYETAKMSLGLGLFTMFWSAQAVLVYAHLGPLWPALYLLSLPPGATAALIVRRERQHIVENLRVFFLFLRRRELRTFLQAARRDIEEDLARLARMAKGGPSS